MIDYIGFFCFGVLSTLAFQNTIEYLKIMFKDVSEENEDD